MKISATALMRLLYLGTLGMFVFFLLVSFLPSSEEALGQAQNHFSDEVIQTGRVYALQRRLLAWPGRAAHLLWLLVLVYSRLGRRLADGCLSWTRGWWLPAVLLMGLAWFVGDYLLGLPFGIARWRLTTSWGMTQQPLAAWLGDYALGMAVALVTNGIVLVGLYLLLRWFPRRWWLLAWLGGTLLGILYAFLLPLAIEPIFNTFTPLAKTPWKDQEAGIRSLVAASRIEVGEVLVIDASRRSQHTNAYFTGFSGTRRIVLYDTLLRKHTTAEVESIVAHEIGHWQHDHIVQGIALASLGALVGFFLLAFLIRGVLNWPPMRLKAPSDPAGLPLILLLVWAGSWLASPLENLVSRSFERQADLVSLKLAGQPEVFIEAEKRLARDNLNNVIPHPLAVWFFYSHPPALDRIRMGEEWGKY